VTTWLNTPIQMQFRVIDGLTVRFAQSQDRDDHALLLSPWPESLLAFEPVWTQLAEHTHLVAIDLPGFGHSQRDDALLSPRAMGEFVLRAADAFGLARPAGPTAQPGRRQRRRGCPASAGRPAEGLGRSPRPGQLPRR
jgi:pimeloyl-ACP methyl ester carboxylesterase